jgi:hypothetical protein
MTLFSNLILTRPSVEPEQVIGNIPRPAKKKSVLQTEDPLVFRKREPPGGMRVS